MLELGGWGQRMSAEVPTHLDGTDESLILQISFIFCTLEIITALIRIK